MIGVLQDHAGWSLDGRCDCGFKGKTDHPFYHRKHLAQVILAHRSSPAATTREWEYGIWTRPGLGGYEWVKTTSGYATHRRERDGVLIGPWLPVPKGDE